MQTVSSTPISFDLRMAAATMWRASSSSSLNAALMSLSQVFEFQVLMNGSSRRRSTAAIDRLDLRIELQAGTTRLAKSRRAGALEPAERRIDQIAGRGAVDLDGSRFDVVREVVDVTRIARRDRSRQPVLGIVGLCDRVCVARHLDERDHRPEYLFARDPHILGDIGKDRGRYVIATVVGRTAQAFAAAQQRRFALADLD